MNESSRVLKSFGLRAVPFTIGWCIFSYLYVIIAILTNNYSPNHRTFGDIFLAPMGTLFLYAYGGGIFITPILYLVLRYLDKKVLNLNTNIKVFLFYGFLLPLSLFAFMFYAWRNM